MKSIQEGERTNDAGHTRIANYSRHSAFHIWPKRLKNIASGLGDAIKGFRKAVTDDKKESDASSFNNVLDEKVIDGSEVESKAKPRRQRIPSSSGDDLIRAMFPDFGGLELLLILVVSLLVLGPEKLPEAARSLAKFLAKWRLTFNRIKRDVETEIGMEDIRRELHNEEVMREIGRIEAEVSEIDKLEITKCLRMNPQKKTTPPRGPKTKNHRKRRF